MSSVLIDETNLTATANAIRSKLGTQSTYTPAGFADAIDSIPTGGGGEQDPADDGKIHLFIHVAPGALKYTMTFTIINGPISIDWGDGTTTSFNASNPSHTYSQSGDYEVVITFTNGQIIFMGDCFGSGNLTTSANIARAIALRRAYIYGGCGNKLSSLSFRNCTNLKRCVIKGENETDTALSAYIFQNCYGLPSVELPSFMASFGQYSFRYCFSLESVTIPQSVTAMGSATFQYCLGLGEIHFRPTTPPTASTNTFGSLPTTCKIYVPTGTLAAYTAAANYPSSETYTYEEERYV